MRGLLALSLVNQERVTTGLRLTRPGVLVQKWVPLPEQGKHRKPTCRSYPGRTAIDGLPGRSYRGTTAILPSNSDPAFAQVTDGNGFLDQDGERTVVRVVGVQNPDSRFHPS